MGHLDQSSQWFVMLGPGSVLAVYDQELIHACKTTIIMNEMSCFTSVFFGLLKICWTSLYCIETIQHLPANKH